MAFLDKMVSDLVKSSTGFNARGLVRAVGGKNILLLGGAAIAGALAADKMGSKSTPPPPVPGGSSTTPPPVPSPNLDAPSAPPVPAASQNVPPPVLGSSSQEAGPPPPLPPLPTEAETVASEAEELPPELVYAIVRTMVAAALADGHMDTEEKELIHKHLGESGLTPDQIAQIHKDLVLPASHKELSTLVSGVQDGELLYRFGALVALADQKVSEHEKAWLEQLAQTLEISPQRRSEIEKEIYS
jgi:tellurite resistance protein